MKPLDNYKIKPTDEEIRRFNSILPVEEHPLYNHYRLELLDLYCKGDAARPLLADVSMRLSEDFWRDKLDLHEFSILTAHVSAVISRWRRMLE